MFIRQSLFGEIIAPGWHGPGPALHNAAFQAWNIPSVFLSWEACPDTFANVLESAALQGVAGLAVEDPHQIAAISLVDRLSPQAARVGAVDTLYVEEGELVGHNAGANAILMSLFVVHKTDSALILGDGPWARAVLAALLSPGGPLRIAIASPNLEKARAVKEEVRPVEDGGHGPNMLPKLPEVTVIPWNERQNIHSDCVLNTLSFIPRKGRQEKEPHEDVFRGQGMAWDFTCGKTPFLGAALAAGWRTMDGKGARLELAKEQFILWTGFPMPDTMKNVLNDLYPQFPMDPDSGY